jgi:hypothetical protein
VVNVTGAHKTKSEYRIIPRLQLKLCERGPAGMTEGMKVVVKVTNSNYFELGQITLDGDTEVHLLLSVIVGEFRVLVEDVDRVWMQYDGGEFDGTLKQTLIQQGVHMCYASGEVTVTLKQGKTVEQRAANVDMGAGVVTFVNCNDNTEINFARNVSTSYLYLTLI